MNRKTKNIISRTLIAGGLTLTAGSIYDNTQNVILRDENLERLRITKELQDKYDIETRCGSSSEPLSTFCRDFVKDTKTNTDDLVPTQYYQELDRRLGEIPQDPEANARGLRDSLGLLGGLIIASAGSAIGSSKERGG